MREEEENVEGRERVGRRRSSQESGDFNYVVYDGHQDKEDDGRGGHRIQK